MHPPVGHQPLTAVCVGDKASLLSSSLDIMKPPPSVFFQYYAAIRHCFEVSRHAFTPVPAVDSTVLSLTPFAALPWPSTPETFFLGLVKCAFAHRRKTLRANLLTASHLGLTKVQLAEIFSTLQLPENIRPQELHVSQFAQRATALHGLLPQGKTAGRRQLQQLP